MAYTTIDNPSDYFNTVLYTGNDSTQSITGVGFEPDWVWIKSRGDTSWPRSLDSSRGATKELYQNVTNTENTESAGLTSFDSDGFSLGSNAGYNGDTVTFAAWNWKNNGGTTSSTSQSGSGATQTLASNYQANATAGFSICTWTATGLPGRINHGLGATPHFWTVKARSISDGWPVYHGSNTAAPETDALQLHTTSATADNSKWWNDIVPTSTYFSLGEDASVTQDTATYIAYVFTSIQGYSKFGGYTGNSNADGTFVYTGFKPAFFMVKATNAIENWLMVDNKRTNSFNAIDGRLIPNSSAAEETNVTPCDFVSNGVKFRYSDGAWNSSSNTYIYMAFAEQPFVTSGGVPCTAR